MRLSIAIFLLLIPLWGAAAPDPTSGATEPQAELLKLPPPGDGGGMPLAAALEQRRSVRELSSAPLTLEQLGLLCWAAQGVILRRSGIGFRTAPSAGALYPLDLYVATADGLYHYLPEEHALKKLAGQDLRAGLGQAALNQACVGQCGALFLITAEYARCAKKYGDRAVRYCQIEVGCAAENLLLGCAALGIGATPVGAFYDERISALLPIPKEHEPLLLIPVGKPAE